MSQADVTHQNKKRPSTSALAELASSLATEAGKVVAEMRREAVRNPDTKSSPTDPVTEADRAAEAVIVDGILAARPDDAIIGEEGTDRSGTSGVSWHIDPIDGTTNYLYGIPAYVVSVAAVIDEEPVAGVVFNPSTGELFAARAGHGATLDGDSIAVGTTSELDRALVATGFGYSADQRRSQADTVARLLPQIRDIRRSGSAAHDLCSVACGRVDAYYEAGLNSWDFAAGWLIATEAGARCSDLSGGRPSSQFLVAAPTPIHGPLIRVLAGDE